MVGLGLVYGFVDGCAGLDQRAVRSPELAEQLGFEFAFLAQSVRVRTYSLLVGDMILAQAQAMEIVACVSNGVSLFLIVSAFNRDSLVSGYGVKWRRLPTLSLFDLSADYVVASYWTYITENELLTI